MVVVVPANTSVLELKGIHLYHANRSNCSARVRLLLEEKELDWTSHHIDLGKKENISEEYFGINPKGVVPALVHDGTVIAESNDILLYLEKQFPEPGFRAVSPDRQSEIDYWLKMSGDLHIPGIKTFQYYNLNAALLEKTEEELALYKKLQNDRELLAFHDKHSEGRSFSEADADAASALLDEYFANRSRRSRTVTGLVGASYTLADHLLVADYNDPAGGARFGIPKLQEWYDAYPAPQFKRRLRMAQQANLCGDRSNVAGPPNTADNRSRTETGKMTLYADSQSRYERLDPFIQTSGSVADPGTWGPARALAVAREVRPGVFDGVRGKAEDTGPPNDIERRKSVCATSGNWRRPRDF